MTTQTFLCFDHGEKRIGVAVGQSVTGTATSLTTLSSKKGQPEWDEVSRLIKEWNPGDIVIGHPLNMMDERQEATDAAERFARQVFGRYRIPVHLIDERLSSLEARQHLKSSYDVDAVAAQLILQTWMEERMLKQRHATISDENEQESNE